MGVNLSTAAAECNNCRTGIFGTTIFSALPVAIILGELLFWIIEIAFEYTCSTFGSEGCTQTSLWDTFRLIFPSLGTVYFAIAIQEVGNIKPMFRVPPSFDSAEITADSRI